MMIAPKRVSSGKYIDLATMTSDDINIEDIDRALNYIYRFTGHSKDEEPLTVAQHTKLCMNISDIIFPNDVTVKFDCLLHDMPEAYYGDLATPLKRLFGEEYRKYSEVIDRLVYNKLWKLDDPFTEEIEQKRKVCDLISLDIERRVMWRDQRGKIFWPQEQIKVFTLNDKYDMFYEVKRDRYVSLKEIYEKFE